MSSITRDTYTPGSTFSAAEISAIASGIGAALEHLHARGLSHGDVYAHNILWRAGRAGVGGAASAGAAGKSGGRKRKHPHQPDGGEEDDDEAAAGGHATAKLSDFGAAFYYGGLPAGAARARCAGGDALQPSRTASTSSPTSLYHRPLPPPLC